MQCMGNCTTCGRECAASDGGDAVDGVVVEQQRERERDKVGCTSIYQRKKKWETKNTEFESSNCHFTTVHYYWRDLFRFFCFRPEPIYPYIFGFTKHNRVMESTPEVSHARRRNPEKQEWIDTYRSMSKKYCNPLSSVLVFSKLMSPLEHLRSNGTRSPFFANTAQSVKTRALMRSVTISYFRCEK
jgi:hypothetical protein